jgi:hypothetical protein
MNILSNPVRAAVLVCLLSLRPASSGFAQAHGAKHGGGAHKAQQAAAKPPAKAVTPPKTATVTHQKAEPDPPGHQQPAQSDEELVASLYSTKTHLAHAGQDNLGHRARALQEVDTAIKLLSPQDKPAGLAKTNLPRQSSTTTAASGPNPPISHLSEARQLLQTVESRMSGDGISSHQYMLARRSIQTAVRELNLALVDQ